MLSALLCHLSRGYSREIFIRVTLELFVRAFSAIVIFVFWKYSAFREALLFSSRFWLVGCFGCNGPLRQYFSLYRDVSQRKGERKRNDRREKKCPNNPHPHRLQAQKAFALLLSKLVGRPGTGTLPSTIAPPDHPLLQ